VGIFKMHLTEDRRLCSFFFLVQGLVVGSFVQGNELWVPEKAGNFLTSWTIN
jgi:hypothetical protein